MKRRLLRICVLFVLGAIVNVAVAWSASQIELSALSESELSPDRIVELWSKYAHDHALPEFDSRAVMSNERFDPRMSGQSVSGERAARVGLTADGVVYFALSGKTGREDAGAVEITAGFPLSALCGAYIWKGVGAPQQGVGAPQQVWYEDLVESPIKGATFTPPLAGQLPVRIIWPGFAINTVFYAAMLWLLFAGPFVLRRLRGGRRIRRGLCPKCAYDLRGTPSDATACPECGATVGQVATVR